MDEIHAYFVRPQGALLQSSAVDEQVQVGYDTCPLESSRQLGVGVTNAKVGALNTYIFLHP